MAGRRLTRPSVSAIGPNSVCAITVSGRARRRASVLIPRLPVCFLLAVTVAVERSARRTLTSGTFEHALHKFRLEPAPATGPITKDEPSRAPEPGERAFDRTRRVSR